MEPHDELFSPHDQRHRPQPGRLFGGDEATSPSARRSRLAGQHSSVDAQHVCEQVAAQCVRALDRVLTMEPVMPKHLREEAYHWLSILPGLRGKEKALRKEFEQHLEGKVARDLL